MYFLMQIRILLEPVFLGYIAKIKRDLISVDTNNIYLSLGPSVHLFEHWSSKEHTNLKFTSYYVFIFPKIKNSIKKIFK